LKYIEWSVNQYRLNRIVRCTTQHSNSWAQQNKQTIVRGYNKTNKRLCAATTKQTNNCARLLLAIPQCRLAL